MYTYRYIYVCVCVCVCGYILIKYKDLYMQTFIIPIHKFFFNYIHI